MTKSPEPPVCKDITRLKPELQQDVTYILQALKHEGYHPFVLETYRTPERAKWLVDHGCGAILDSEHCKCRACDIGFKDEHGNAIWAGDYPGWPRLAHYARERGLVAGHDWKKVDCPHVQMK